MLLAQDGLERLGGGGGPPGRLPDHRDGRRHRRSEGGGAGTDTYADIALLPNLAGTGYVLILAGLDMAATEAAGDLVASQEFPDLLNRIMRSRSSQPPASYFEILVQQKAVGGTAEGSKIMGLTGKKPIS